MCLSDENQNRSPKLLMKSHDDRAPEEFKEEIESKISSLQQKRNSLSQLSEETAFISFDIIIEDTGLGIPPDKINSLFVNFSKIKKH
jgi:hypothetical protein